MKLIVRGYLAEIAKAPSRCRGDMLLGSRGRKTGTSVGETAALEEAQQEVWPYYCE